MVRANSNGLMASNIKGHSSITLSQELAITNGKMAVGTRVNFSMEKDTEKVSISVPRISQNITDNGSKELNMDLAHYSSIKKPHMRDISNKDSGMEEEK